VFQYGQAVGPIELILVRHGESIGNVASDHALHSEAEEMVIGQRDPDVPLSSVGIEQAQALGKLLGSWEVDRRPDAVWSSPYVRARQTAEFVLDAAGMAARYRQDERLRDRELGVLDHLTSHGVASRFAGEAARKRWLGKFYYRPPGGESWVDVALRIRSFLADLDRIDSASRPLIVAHDAVILLFRYACEELDESALMEIAQAGSVKNASVTRLTRKSVRERWHTEEFNAIEHLRAHRSDFTDQPNGR
jgi:broad specificity phosphatase PhoE